MILCDLSGDSTRQTRSWHRFLLNQIEFEHFLNFCQIAYHTVGSETGYVINMPLPSPWTNRNYTVEIKVGVCCKYFSMKCYRVGVVQRGLVIVDTELHWFRVILSKNHMIGCTLAVASNNQLSLKRPVLVYMVAVACIEFDVSPYLRSFSQIFCSLDRLGGFQQLSSWNNRFWRFQQLPSY